MSSGFSVDGRLLSSALPQELRQSLAGAAVVAGLLALVVVLGAIIVAGVLLAPAWPLDDGQTAVDGGFAPAVLAAAGTVDE
jgi:peptidoglycan biosynthesis protein MviN/MurJ (putative lipid II flippase)